MDMRRQFSLLLQITRSHAIARRYFVVNGFDGALTMLGIIVGFYLSNENSTSVILSACLGAAIALGMSGISSAYISESAEQQQELRALEDAMVTDLSDSAHGQAARLIPALIALINGMAPLLISLLIISPLWLTGLLARYAIDPLLAAMGMALVIIFLLGVFLGTISSSHWLLAGLRTLLIALFTCGLIFILTPG